MSYWYEGYQFTVELGSERGDDATELCGAGGLQVGPLGTYTLCREAACTKQLRIRRTSNHQPARAGQSTLCTLCRGSWDPGPVADPA